MRNLMRWLPRRLRAPLAAGLVGALLGAAAVAWRTDTLPRVGGSEACWGSLSDDDVEELAGTGDARVEELRPDGAADFPFTGTCRISADESRVDIRVHRVADLGRDHLSLTEDWVREFLTSGMTWLDDGLTGMASPTKAWLAIPETCEPAGEFEGPLIVDASTSPRADQAIGPQGDGPARRDLLARVVTRSANGILELLDCDGSLPEPTGLPDVPGPETGGRQATLCGIDGFTRPRGVPAAEIAVQRISNGGGPIRSCELMPEDGYDHGVRLTTIEEPSLTQAMYDLAEGRGESFAGEEVWGTLSAVLGVAHAECQTGRVMFLVQRLDLLGLTEDDTVRALLPAYVEAEAKRIGCDPLTVELPG